MGKKKSARDMALEACDVLETWLMPPIGDVTKLHGTERKLYRLATEALMRAKEEDESQA